MPEVLATLLDIETNIGTREDETSRRGAGQEKMKMQMGKGRHSSRLRGPVQNLEGEEKTTVAMDKGSYRH